MNQTRAKGKRDRLIRSGARVVFVLLEILLCALACPSAVGQQNAKNVLVLFSAKNDEWNKEFLSLVDATIRARVPGPITIYDESLTWELDKSGRDFYLESEAETFRRTYARVHLDLLIVVAPDAVQLAKRYRNKLFPGVPILFTGVGTREPEAQPEPGITGLATPVALGETIDLALRLHPDTQTMAVISGPDEFWIGVAHSELQRYRNKVREIDFAELPSRDLLARVVALPPHTVVLFQLAPDLNRPELGGWELLAAVAKRWPTYSAWPTLCVNHGCVGGVWP
jgi:hypothetical protein